MKKLEKNWALAALLSVGLVAATAEPIAAQVSFGQMREAAKKINSPKTDEKSDPKTAETSKNDDSDDAAFDVDPNERAASAPETKPAFGRTTLKPANAEKANQEKEKGKDDATATNGIADAFSEPLVDEKTPEPVRPTAPTTSASASSTRSTSKRNAAETSKNGPILGNAKSTKYRAGMIFEARPNGTCSDLFGSAPIPTEFPEQKVRTLEENFPNVARVSYRDLKEGGARQMIFQMNKLKPGQRVEATVLFEVTRYPILPPENPALYSIAKNPSREIRRYLKESPYIEANSRTIRTLAKETTGEIDGAWDKIDAILKYVRDNITYKESQIEKPMRGAIAALQTKDGDCEDMSALFIAMCRSLEIPARLVRVPGHCWAEFYLVDDEKNGFWFPAQVAGTEPLGSMQDVRVILQKGDSFRLPESPKEETLYVKELFTGSVQAGSPDPIYQFIQESDAK